MEWLSNLGTFVALIAPSVIAIINSFNQVKINKQNNDYQLNINNQNNNNQLQLKHLEYYRLEKISAINNYLDNLNIYLNEKNKENLDKYKLSMIKVSMYVSKETRDIISDIDYMLKEENINNVEHYVSDYFLEVLNSEAQEYNNSN